MNCMTRVTLPTFFGVKTVPIKKNSLIIMRRDIRYSFNLEERSDHDRSFLGVFFMVTAYERVHAGRGDRGNRQHIPYAFFEKKKTP